MKRKPMRRLVHERDHGVCTNCRLDTEVLQLRIIGLSTMERIEAMRMLESAGFNRGDTIMWQADHILALDEGGKDELDNITTLCIPCHKEKSSEQSSRGARRRRLIGRKRIPHDGMH